jgi:hypothetical protein
MLIVVFALDHHSTMKDSQQINVVDDATLQAALSAMSETEMNTFLEELNKTGKACKSIRRDRHWTLFRLSCSSFTWHRSNH